MIVKSDNTGPVLAELIKMKELGFLVKGSMAL